jgi:hypothetical protein
MKKGKRERHTIKNIKVERKKQNGIVKNPQKVEEKKTKRNKEKQ